MASRGIDFENRQWERYYKRKEVVLKKICKDGNFREYLKINFKNINWKQKLCNLSYLSRSFIGIHKLDIVHQDFHPGNILSKNFTNSYPLKISD
ncbi:hypothetical protein Glove_490g57 [Diversispora epigaea]|uniref:Protein kinase domain-containing protein n=1 Tax=Diversispora epigaea TaxID=1348612 RepID=A0A397GIT2_9GLOM|nr:hypothetical protein Glove_490g57 [Diversispora epigaea]